MAGKKRALRVNNLAVGNFFSLNSKKKQLTQQQEFEIMKMVLDKLLWFGFIIMVVGLFVMLRGPEAFGQGLFLLSLGALMLLIFTILLVKEYEVFK